jgi:hypothetical protein
MFVDLRCFSSGLTFSSGFWLAEAGTGSLFNGIWIAAPHCAHLPPFPARAAGARSWAPHFLQNVTIVFATRSADITPSY